MVRPVYTAEQNLTLQTNALAAAGCERIFDETVSGAQRDRPELLKALDYMRLGDTLVVWKLDRLARSMRQFIDTVELLLLDRGDLVWLEFNPQACHDPAGHRLALVLFPKAYNQAADLALMCPIASKEKGYPFETALPDGLKISGVVLADQIKSLDWRARKASQADAAPSITVNDVQAKLEALLG